MAEQSLTLAENALALRLRAKRYLDPESMANGKASAGNQHDLALAELRQALALAPNDADTLADLADTLVFAGEADEAGKLMRQAMRLNPNFPAWYYRPAGIAYPCVPVVMVPCPRLGPFKFCHNGGRCMSLVDIGATHDLSQRGVGQSGRESVMAMGGFCRNAIGPPEWECEAMGSMMWVQCTNLCRVFIKSIESRVLGYGHSS
jgi:tetratricopeptide (TPR) repeat protein